MHAEPLAGLARALSSLFGLAFSPSAGKTAAMSGISRSLAAAAERNRPSYSAFDCRIIQPTSLGAQTARYHACRACSSLRSF
jgi:hypothetical protein